MSIVNLALETIPSWAHPNVPKQTKQPPQEDKNTWAALVGYLAWLGWLCRPKNVWIFGRGHHHSIWFAAHIMSDVLLATCEFRQPNPQLWLCVYVYPCVRVTVCVEKNTFRLLRVCVCSCHHHVSVHIISTQYLREWRFGYPIVQLDMFWVSVWVLVYFLECFFCQVSERTTTKRIPPSS